MAFTLCTSGAAKLAAGLNANSTLTASNDNLSIFSEEAEDYICTLVRSDVVTNFGSLTSNGKKTLGRLAANIIAQKIITYDASGYTSRFESELMLDVLENQIRKDEELVKEDKFKTYLGIST